MKTKYIVRVGIHGSSIPLDYSVKSFNNLNDATDYLFEKLDMFFKDNKKKRFDNAIDREIFKHTRGDVWVLEVEVRGNRYFEGKIE